MSFLMIALDFNINCSNVHHSLNTATQIKESDFRILYECTRSCRSHARSCTISFGNPKARLSDNSYSKILVRSYDTVLYGLVKGNYGV